MLLTFGGEKADEGRRSRDERRLAHLIGGDSGQPLMESCSTCGCGNNAGLSKSEQPCCVIIADAVWCSPLGRKAATALKDCGLRGLPRRVTHSEDVQADVTGQ
jgi:hypothetical protein